MPSAENERRAKHVVPEIARFRTGVRFPPPPPFQAPKQSKSGQNPQQYQGFWPFFVAEAIRWLLLQSRDNRGQQWGHLPHSRDELPPMSLTDIAILWPIFTFWWWLDTKIRRAPEQNRTPTNQNIPTAFDGVSRLWLSGSIPMIRAWLNHDPASSRKIPQAPSTVSSAASAVRFCAVSTTTAVGLSNIADTGFSQGSLWSRHASPQMSSPMR